MHEQQDRRYLGLDVGGTKLAAVVGTADGEITHRFEAPTPHGASDCAQAVAELIRLATSVCAAAGLDPVNAPGIGISCGGPLNPVTGVVINPPNLPEWHNVPICKIIREALGNSNVILENDANTTALAEHRWGAGIGTRHMAYLTFGTGMGAGLILDGKLYRGERDLAGEIGHATILPDGPPCPCGKRGCLEVLSSGGGIDRIARAKYGDPSMNAARVCDLARQGDSMAQGIVEDASRYLGIGIANLLQTLDLEMVVLGSLALKSGDLFMEPIKRYAREYTWASIFDKVEIVPAGLGAQAQDKAALVLAISAGKD